MPKKELRQYIRNEKRQHSQETLEALSLSVCQKVLSHPRVLAADTILLYYPLHDEVDVRPVIDALAAQGKNILLPKVISDTELTLHPYHSAADLSPGAFGIMEPVTAEIIVNEESCETTKRLNDQTTKRLVSIIPGMAFDRQGHRLGRGKGYYDRLLSRFPYIYKIGICFPFQLLEEIPADAHDVVMDEVIV